MLTFIRAIFINVENSGFVVRWSFLSPGFIHNPAPADFSSNGDDHVIISISRSPTEGTTGLVHKTEKLYLPEPFESLWFIDHCLLRLAKVPDC